MDLSKVPGRYHALVEAAVNRLRALPGYQGTVLFGSVVEGEPTNRSRLDVLALFSDERHYFGQVALPEGPVTLVLRGMGSVLREVIAYRSHPVTRDLAAGLLVDWASDQVIEVKSIAEAAWREGPARPPPSWHMLIRQRYSNVLAEIATSDRGDARAYLHAWTLDRAVGDFYSIHALYLPKRTYLLSELRVIDTRFADLLIHYLSSGGNPEHDTRLKALVDELLERIGGPPPDAWTTDLACERTLYRTPSDGAWIEYRLPAPGLPSSTPLLTGRLIPPFPGSEKGLDATPRFLAADGSADVRRLITNIVETNMQCGDVLGVLLYGSRSSGTARRDSDIDLYFITGDSGRSMRSRWREGGLAVDAQWVRLSDLCLGILNRSNTSYMTNMAEGTLVFHRDIGIPYLKRLAEMLCSRGLAPLRQSEVDLMRAHLGTILDDGDAIAERGDWPSLLYNDNYLFCRTIDHWFRSHNRPDVKRSRRMEAISGRDTTMYSLAMKYLGTHDVFEKHLRLSELVEYVLGPFGGRLSPPYLVAVVPHPPLSVDAFGLAKAPPAASASSPQACASPHRA